MTLEHIENRIAELEGFLLMTFPNVWKVEFRNELDQLIEEKIKRRNNIINEILN